MFDLDESEKIAPMMEDGFRHISTDVLQPGIRVHNAGEQYYEAYDRGTATIVAVMRKEGYWEQTYGRKNIEVLVRRDRDGMLAWWQDYRTFLARNV